MMKYLIMCEHAADSQERRRSTYAAHLRHIHALPKKHYCSESGSFYANTADLNCDTPTGTLILAEFDSLDDAKAWAAADPFSTAQVYSRILVYPYREHTHEQ